MFYIYIFFLKYKLSNLLLQFVLATIYVHFNDLSSVSFLNSITFGQLKMLCFFLFLYSSNYSTFSINSLYCIFAKKIPRPFLYSWLIIYLCLSLCMLYVFVIFTLFSLLFLLPLQFCYIFFLYSFIVLFILHNIYSNFLFSYCCCCLCYCC